MQTISLLFPILNFKEWALIQPDNLLPQIDDQAYSNTGVPTQVNTTLTQVKMDQQESKTSQHECDKIFQKMFAENFPKFLIKVPSRNHARKSLWCSPSKL